MLSRINYIGSNFFDIIPFSYSYHEPERKSIEPIVLPVAQPGRHTSLHSVCLPFSYFVSFSSSNFDSNIRSRCWTLIIVIGIGIAVAIEYVAFEVYSILIPAPITITNPSFHVIVIISALASEILTFKH
jgi:hypothetical protein